MLKPINPGATRMLTCPYDTGEVKTEFTIAPLSVEVRAMLKDRLVTRVRDTEDKTSIQMNIYQTNAEAVRYGLRSVANFVNGEGHEVKLRLVPLGKYQVVADESMEKLNIPLGEVGRKDGYDSLLDWLGSQIMKGSYLSEEETQNFN